MILNHAGSPLRNKQPSWDANRSTLDRIIRRRENGEHLDSSLLFDPFIQVLDHFLSFVGFVGHVSFVSHVICRCSPFSRVFLSG